MNAAALLLEISSRQHLEGKRDVGQRRGLIPNQGDEMKADAAPPPLAAHEGKKEKKKKAQQKKV